MKVLNRVAAAWLILLNLLVTTGSLAQPTPPTPPSGELLDAWSFENTNWTSFFHQSPIAFSNLTLYPDWAGNGLLLDTSNAAFLNYAVVSTEGKTNLSLTNGTLAVWFSPDWNTSDGIGNWGTLLEVGTWNMTLSNATGAWGLYFSPDGENIYFSAQTNGAWTNYLAAPITWYAGDWHQITVTYSLTNTALYLEGAFVTNGPGISVGPSATIISNGFSVGSDGFDTARLQARGMFNDLETYNYILDAETISNNYADDAEIVFPLPSSGGGFSGDYSPPSPGDGGSYTNDGGGGTVGSYNDPAYGSNQFWIEIVPFGTNSNSSTSNYLSLILNDTVADTLYEVQSVTNLQEYNAWMSEGFIYGSELTNWTPFFVADNSRSNLFLRIRSWQDSTGTGIPDWWWLAYFGQITNVNAYATNAGDGLNNFQKFQLGLNPLTYFNSNAPPGFFGSLVGSNVVLQWQPAPGPVTNYAVQRGILNTNTGNFVYSQIALLGSNATYFVDTGAISNTLSHSNVYLMEAIYPGGSVSGTNTWQVSSYLYDSYYGPVPPPPNTINACLDSTGTNVLMSWTAANGPAAGYTVVMGYFTNTAGTQTYVPVATVSSNVFSYTIINPFTNSAATPAAFYVEANYAAGAKSAAAGNGEVGDELWIGSFYGVSGPADFFGYVDDMGTNTYLQWDAVPGATGYYILANGGTLVALLGSNVTSFTVTNSTDDYYFDVIATFADGSVSQKAEWDGGGPPAPASFYACIDATGTNILLNWTPVASPAIGYTIQFTYGIYNGYGWETLTNLPLSATNFTDIDPFSDPDFDYYYTNGAMYQIIADYPNGGASAGVTAGISSSPPPAANLSAVVNSTGTNVALTWTPSVMPVSNYTILRATYNPTNGVTSFTVIATVSATTTNYTDTTAGSLAKNDVYEVVANYTGWAASGADVTQVTSFPAPASNTLSIAVQFVRDETGRWELVFPYLPTNVAAIAFYEYSYYYWDDSIGPSFSTTYSPTFYDEADYGNDPFYTSENDIPVSSITNGRYVLPDYILTNWFPNNEQGKHFMVQPIDTNGNYGNLVSAGFQPYDMPRFVDARVHLKQNLLFYLREAGVSDASMKAYEQNWYDSPQLGNLSLGGDTNYAESSIFHSSVMNKGYASPNNPNGFYDPYVQMDDVWPVTVNYELFADLYDTNTLTTSFNWQTDTGYINYPYEAPWYFIGTLSTNPAPPVLGIADPYWIQQSAGASDTSGFYHYGCSLSGSTVTFSSGSKNVYGLTYESILIDAAHVEYDENDDPVFYPNVTLAPGASTALSNISCFYSQTVDPSLTLQDYYFAPVNTPGMALTGQFTPTQVYPVPIGSGFANSNTTQLQITSVGTPTVFGGWARYTIANGSSTKRAYLGQYFETNAFVITNGVFTTNTTGIVSPYGDFLPTAPGTVAMVTMPDVDTGVQGTNVVRVISLNADANHDGVMDFDYFGPDSVSTNHPFRFWVNDNQDSGDDFGTGIPGAEFPDGSTQIPVQSAYNPEVIRHVWTVHGRRDLVDFFPVCVNISSVFQSNALSAGISPADTNYQFVLSQADGILRFAYTGLTPTNYMNFLLDTNESGLLAYTNLTTITASGVVLSNTFLSGIAASNQCVILIEAASSTTNPLVLTILHGTNQIAQTQLALSISGVEQMFRNKNLLLTADSRSKPDRLTAADVPNEPDTTSENFIFVHGYNVNPDQARGWFADMYKRLYWSGSHAKFYGVTWTAFDSQIAGEVSINLQTNIVHAFNTAPLLNNFLNTLSGTNVVAAHSLGNMLVLSTLNDYSNQNISTFCMLDAAVAIEAIDTSASLNPDMYPTAWTNYQTRLWASEWHNLFPTNDARSQLTWSGRLANVQNASVYNFYSSGEEVLRDYPTDPPTDYIHIALSQLVSIWQGNEGANAWAFQEKLKGLMLGNSFLSSDHGGWLFNPAYIVDLNGDEISPANAASLSNSVIQTNALFDWGSLTGYSVFTNDLILQTSAGGAYAQTNRNRILSDAIPCLTLPVGANPVSRLAQLGQPNKNFDMQTNYENGWPFVRGPAQYPVGTIAFGEWHHSDVRAVAYTFTYPIFNKIVTVGNLK